MGGLQVQMPIQVFEYERQARIRTINIDGEIWWVAKDVCDVLGIKNVSDAISRLDDDEKRDDIALTDTIGRRQFVATINEPGLYTLILRSDKTEAKKFKRWVTHEVLPQLRKTGRYSILGAGLPVFVRRFNDNWDRIEQGYFSVIGELFVRVYGRMEQAGYVIADTAPDGKELRPDVSVGKLFPQWLNANYPDLEDTYKEYWHLLPNGREVPARQYKNDILPQFIEYIESVWLLERAEAYFKKRDRKALAYLPKLLMYRPKTVKQLT